MNYYEVLGVDREASVDQIKKAYKKLAKKWHPDLNRDNPQLANEKMTEINIAYSTLSDEVARIDYNKKLDAEAARAKQPHGQSTAGTQQRRRPGQQAGKRKAADHKVTDNDFENIHSSFEQFFGFDPKTRTVTDEDKLNTYTKDRRKKNPLDASDMFARFMGFKA
ncbi:MAG: J domain-containing protein [Selenomonadaceae bacterium]|nr:J domain-containing protein [Selenomonadaceae bacterium]MBR1580452.1 J domain-containing protein [Selenomonadaceae bacterium]